MKLNTCPYCGILFSGDRASFPYCCYDHLRASQIIPTPRAKPAYQPPILNRRPGTDNRKPS